MRPSPAMAGSRRPPSRLVFLQELSFPGDLVQIGELPNPKELLDQASVEELEWSLGYFRGLLLVLTQPGLWQEGESSKASLDFVHGGTSRFWNLVSVVARYYVCAVYRLAIETNTPRAAAEFIVDSPLPTADRTTQVPTSHVELSKALALLVSNDACTIKLFVSAMYDKAGFQPGELPPDQDADIEAVEGFENLFEVLSEVPTPAQQMATELLSAAFSYRKEVLRQRYESRHSAMQKSMEGLSPRELRLLARRGDAVVQKYGAKRVERIFEQRLALLFQSLGFTVVPAKPGEEAADLLCVARMERFSFLVDAKSTRGKYALPKKDSRALIDYVRYFSESVPDIPPLSMVLLVGPEAAQTVPAKLSALQDEVNLPVRFIPVGVLSALRQSLAGPVPARVFQDAVREADPVVTPKIVDHVSNRLDGLSSAYSRFLGDLREVFAR